MNKNMAWDFGLQQLSRPFPWRQYRLSQVAKFTEHTKECRTIFFSGTVKPLPDYTLSMVICQSASYGGVDAFGSFTATDDVLSRLHLLVWTITIPMRQNKRLSSHFRVELFFFHGKYAWFARQRDLCISTVTIAERQIFKKRGLIVVRSLQWHPEVFLHTDFAIGLVIFRGPFFFVFFFLRLDEVLRSRPSCLSNGTMLTEAIDLSRRPMLKHRMGELCSYIFKFIEIVYISGFKTADVDQQRVAITITLWQC